MTLSVAPVPIAATTGAFVAVVGPSGVGKDSIMRAAAARLMHEPAFVFVRRIVTREADSNEDHDATDEETFAALERSGAFALSWTANGLSYGLPASLIDDLAEGHVVAANVSRDSIPAARQRFQRSVVVHITASVETLRERLAQRGRESEEERDLRIARSLMREQSVRADVRIENNGSLDDAAELFVNVLRALSSHRAVPH
jgi:ribose 1,5-bisphosphokinase